MINRLTRINKSKYYKTFFHEHKINSKWTWKALRSLINVKIISNKQITSLNINDQIETNPKTISEAFNKFFSTIAKDTDNKIVYTNKTHYGVRGTENNWFTIYLTNRKQCVTVSGQTSDTAMIEFGVPQGSVLGPLLFLIYINDLNQAIKFSRVHHFAEDTNLLPVDNSLKKINKHINHNFKLLTTWLRANRISLNTSKTEILLFRPKSKRNITKHLNFRISGQYIPRTTQVKYLGLTMNGHLDWDL